MVEASGTAIQITDRVKPLSRERLTQSTEHTLQTVNATLSHLFRPMHTTDVLPSVSRSILLGKDAMVAIHNKRETQQEISPDVFQALGLSIATLEFSEESLPGSEDLLGELKKTRTELTRDVIASALVTIGKEFRTFEHQLHNDQDLKQKLNQDLLADTVFPQLEAAGVPQKTIDTFATLFEESFSLRVPNYGDTDYLLLTDRLYKNREALQRIFRELQGTYHVDIEELTRKVVGGGHSGKQKQFTSDDSYDHIFSLMVRTNELHVLRQLQQIVATEIGNDESIRREIALKIAEREAVIDLHEIDPRTLTEQFTVEELMQRMPVVRKVLAEENLETTSVGETVAAVLQQKIIDALFLTKDHTPESIDLGYALFAIQPNSNIIPIVILNSLREQGSSGEKPFINGFRGSEESLLYRYISSLPESLLQQPDLQKLPGVLEIIDVIKQNPSTFTRKDRPNPEWNNPDWQRFYQAYIKKYGVQVDGNISRPTPEKIGEIAQQVGVDEDIVNRVGPRELPNPEYQRLMRGLLTLSLHYVEKNPEQMQFFILSVLREVDGDLGTEGYQVIGKLLREANQPEIQNELLAMVVSRFNDTQLVQEVIKSYDFVSGELQERIRQLGPELLERFIIPGIPEEDLKAFAHVLNTKPEEIRQVVAFIKGLTETFPYQYLTVYKPENLTDYIELMKEPSIVPFLENIAGFGYHFQIEHGKALLRLASDSTELLTRIKQIRDEEPTYQYEIMREYRAHQGEQSEEVLITDPYDIYIRQFAHELPGRFYAMYQQGKLTQEYTQAYRQWTPSTTPKGDSEDFYHALQEVFSTIEHGNRERNERFYLQNYILHSLARDPTIARVLTALPQTAPLLMESSHDRLSQYIFSPERSMVQNNDELIFFNKLLLELGEDAEYFIHEYVEGINTGTISQDKKDLFFTAAKAFSQTFTPFSPEEMKQFAAVSETEFGKIVSDRGLGESVLLDYACFATHDEQNKLQVAQHIVSTLSPENLKKAFQYLRWLPNEEVSPEDTVQVLQTKYELTQERLRVGFQQIFASNQTNFPQDMSRQIESLCARFHLPSRMVTIDSQSITLPVSFIKQFTQRRREDSSIQFVPELASFFIEEITRVGSAYTVEDLIFSQIGGTRDLVGRRRDALSTEGLLEAIEDNIDASTTVWKTAMKYHAEQSRSPLFIIANERTAPADLAAEYLPQEFAQRVGINQAVNYEKFFEWFTGNTTLISELYNEHLAGREVKDKIPQEVLEWLGVGTHNLIPIYRIKVPSSLSSAEEEPEGIDTVVNFLKFVSIVEGRSLFMDESTRSAPRSIECLYNVIERRQSQLACNIRLFGKINGAVGQLGTKLEESMQQHHRMEIGFIDPWESEKKPVNDDSEGFVPEITGKGVVEVVHPSRTAISPYGIGTLQDFWKQLVAAQVVRRF